MGRQLIAVYFTEVNVLKHFGGNIGFPKIKKLKIGSGLF